MPDARGAQNPQGDHAHGASTPDSSQQGRRARAAMPQVDARTAKTAAALRAAVLELASRTPLDDITAVELAAAAGVTRRTLYNHAPSPQHLLVSILQPELDGVQRAFRRDLLAGLPPAEAWGRGEVRLAEHLRAFGDVYSAGLEAVGDHMSPTLAHLLSDTFEAGVLETLRSSPASTPDHASVPDRVRITARFIGHGLVGAIEAWLATPDRSTAEFAASALLSIPSWLRGVG